MISEQTPLDIPFFDIDSMGVAWHGHYCKYFELARCNLLEKIGYTYRHMADSEYIFPIVDMRTKFIKPLVFGQGILIDATLVEWEIRIKINYNILDSATHEKLTTGYTIQAVVHEQEKHLQLRCPEEFISKVRACLP